MTSEKGGKERNSKMLAWLLDSLMFELLINNKKLEKLKLRYIDCPNWIK